MNDKHNLGSPRKTKNDLTYAIVRFFKDGGGGKIIKRGLSLEEAQKHCNKPKTSGEGWFDGFRKE